MNKLIFCMSYAPRKKKQKNKKRINYCPTSVQSEIEAKKPDPYAFKYNYPLKYMQSFSSAL